MKIVFLDFDGVLNSHAYCRSVGLFGEMAGVMGLDPQAVSRVNRIVKETEAEVVISSTWRHNRTCVKLTAILQERGFIGVVRGMTPRWLNRTPGGIYAAESRGQEIQAWLNAAPDYGIDVDAFVILDDDSDMGHLEPHLVKTRFELGLTDEDADRAIYLLRSQQPANPPVTTHAGKVRFT